MNKIRHVFPALTALVTSLTLSGISLADVANGGSGCNYQVSPASPPNDGILFVDNSPAGRSGHLGHALVEYEDGKILAFYPNCSGDNNGHSAVGWMEYKRSEDGGKTWGGPNVLAYSKKLFDSGQAGGTETEKYSAFAEKAVVTDKGEIVVFFLVCNITNDAIWRRFQVPTYIISTDGGHTWSEPFELAGGRGRVYDARYYNGEILALHFKNDNEIKFWGNSDQHVYELFVSGDGGRTFKKRSELPFDTAGKSYGTMGMLGSGELVVYIYNKDAEHTMDYVVSVDGGRTWSDPETAHFQKKIRNGQMATLNGCYFMHGRSGHHGEKTGKGHFVLYSSRDGLKWDGGVIMKMREAGTGAYSNSLVVGSRNAHKRNRLLIQASHAYEKSKTNVFHWWLDVTKQAEWTRRFGGSDSP